MVKITMGKQRAGQEMGPGAGVKEELQGVARRMKMLEERYTNLRSKFQVTDQNMLNKHKTFFSEIKTLNLEMTEVKKEIADVKDKMMILLRELEGFAKKENVDILKKYLNLWEPVNFVTHNEVEDVVKDVIEKMQKKKYLNRDKAGQQ
ncbi:hypothetical protein GOV09_04470 [Candidatus Woesearchaeota archaeon]|nr:hypothetical protein [Candidatus Woesearchaeota archaeon]